VVNLVYRHISHGSTKDGSQGVYKDMQNGNKVVSPAVPKTLDICRKSQRRMNNKPGWGLPNRRSSFTARGRHTILEGGVIMDNLHGKQCMFFTGTIPGSGEQVFSTFARYSGYMANLVMQQVRRIVPDPDYMWVYEWQKRGALHMHLVVAFKTEKQAELLSCRLRAAWIRGLQLVSNESGVDLFDNGMGDSYAGSLLFVRCDCQTVTKSVGRYLAKYVSKAAGEATSKARFYPGRWWSVSYRLLRAIKESRVTAFSYALTNIQAKMLRDRLVEIIKNQAVALVEIVNPWVRDVTGAKSWFNAGDVLSKWKEVIIGFGEHLPPPIHRVAPVIVEQQKLRFAV